MTMRTVPALIHDGEAWVRAEDYDAAVALRDAAEIAVTALLPVLPLTGAWGSGYAVNERVDSTIRALPEEWAEAAHAIGELHRALCAL